MFLQLAPDIETQDKATYVWVMEANRLTVSPSGLSPARMPWCFSLRITGFEQEGDHLERTIAFCSSVVLSEGARLPDSGLQIRDVMLLAQVFS